MIKDKKTDGTKKKEEAFVNKKADNLEVVIESIKSKFGDGAIMKLGDAKRVDVDSISTGSVSLDMALGVGGVPRGRIIEVFGPESSGKTTLTLHIVAEAQKKGGVAAFVDAEHALDPVYAKNIGVNTKDLLISQPDTGEQALDIVETLVKSDVVDLVIVDSVAALTPRVEIEGEMGQQHMGLQARLMSHALRKLTAIVAKHNTIVVFINQIRMKIGVVFGNPETTTGGNALKFYSSVRIDIRRKAQIKKGEDVIGNRIKVKVVKNKVAAPFKIAEFDIMYNEGISYESDLLNLAINNGVVKKSGAWIIYNDEKLGQGMDNARKLLKSDKPLTKKILSEVKEKIKEAQKEE
jgi:recombination protein RecA